MGKRVDGNPVHAKNPKEYVAVGNLEDGKFHPIAFTWHTQSKTFDLKLDNKDIFKNDTFPKSVFNGQTVFFGFTAATGAAYNKQIVRGVYCAPR